MFERLYIWRLQRKYGVRIRKVNGRLQEMKSFKAWLDNLVPPDKPKQLPEEFKNHIKDRFERTK